MSLLTGQGPPVLLSQLAPRRALVLLWSAFGVALFDLLVGGGWDAAYHRTQPFDGFFSPPHLFIYALVAVMLAIVARLVLDPRTRGCFPRGALVVLLGGCAGMVLAGPLDAIWHTVFGLDETQWSLPHAMIGQSLAVLTTGFVACRLGLAWHRPAWTATWYLLGYLLVYASGTLLGPLGANSTREAVQQAGGLGALGGNAAYQHLVRVIVVADLTHTNAVFPVLAALWCALAIGLARGLDGRARYWLVVLTLVGLSMAGSAGSEARRLGFATDQAVSTPLPLLTAVLVYLLGRRLAPDWRYGLSGLAVGLHSWSVWGSEHPLVYPLGVAAAPFAAALGARIARWLAHLLRHPEPGPAVTLVLVAVLGLPILTGAIDLSLRMAIPCQAPGSMLIC